METAEKEARDANLLAHPGQPPTDLDKAIAASGDPNWQTRPWSWSDLNGDGKIEYTKDNPEFRIAFNSNLTLAGNPCATFRPDGAFVYPLGERGGGNYLLVIPPKTVNGKALYDWGDAKKVPLTDGERIAGVVAQDSRYYVLRCSSRSSTEGNVSSLECYDESGKLLNFAGRANTMTST